MKALELLQDLTGLVLVLLVVALVMLGFVCYNVCSTFEDRS